MGDNENDRKQKCLDFLRHENHSTKYEDKIKDTITDKKFRLLINMNDIRDYDGDLAAEITRNPRQYIISFQQAASEIAKDDPSQEKILKINDLQVGFEGSLGANAVSPRGLLSSLLNNLVEVEGIVTKCSSVKPKLVKSVQYCPKKNSFPIREYRDETDIDIGIEVEGRIRFPTGVQIPSKDGEDDLETEFGLCQYKDYQKLTLQEMPERARVGQLPRSIDVIVERDLVDRVKPGDRIKCTGVYRPLAGENVTFRTMLMGNNISVIGKEVGAVRTTAKDIQNIKAVAERPKILELLASSLCPTICGHESVKKALVLQLLGGIERNLENGGHIRGDINIMMVGDPSVAKSQMLRAIMEIAPLAISTTGRGSSGVGLTAAVTSDSDTGERRLEAGAMVLADRGIVCIDEFDKMAENDRVAIHEVMEQQTVTIAKAGIHASLNARCSVLAAANPIYGNYDKSRRPQDNIGLPDSLLSRFDLLFIMLDQLDPSSDRMLSEHVIKCHQFRRPGTVMEPEPFNHTSLNLDEDNEERITNVWQRGGRLGDRAVMQGDGRAGDILSKEFLRKYIFYAKNRNNAPKLSEEAMENISTAYANMRAKQTKQNLPITARSLETIIRLSTAHAKARLSENVENEDVECAVELMHFVLFHEIGSAESASAPKSRKQASPASMGATSNDEDEDDDNDDDNGKDNEIPSSRGRRQNESSEENVMKRQKNANDLIKTKGDVYKKSDEYRRLMAIINKMSTSEGTEQLQLSRVVDSFMTAIRSSTSSLSQSIDVTEDDVEAMLYMLEKDNKILVVDDTINIV